jgi:hypothetical protein
MEIRKRIAVVAASALIMGLTQLGTMAAHANTPVNGAAFTTVNENALPDGDGTGHCKNGNPAVNCNIYDGKDFVWLNGGPAVAYVGDGDYFFAVLDPGGQANPNDGAAKNLSDESPTSNTGAGDDYTNRTFSVSGGIVTYSGTHDFNDNKIRLMRYDDTTNPGGVYILAICSLADGYPVNASDCKYDAFKVQTGPVPDAAPLTISKDANGSYKNKYAWTISKDVDKTTVQQVGGSATFNYTIEVTHDAGTISDVKVTGTISVFNPNVDAQNDTVPVDIDGVTDQLSDGTVCTVTDGGAQTLTAAKTDFAYSCTLSAIPGVALHNTAEVTWSAQFLDNGATLDSGSADFTFTGDITFTENTVDECVDVTDSYAGSLGTACVGGANPKSFTYSRTITVPTNGCLDYDNTATFTTNDTGATGSAEKTVTVCGPARTGALTIGFWKTTNGNGLISGYCAPTSKTSLATYLSSLGSGNGPFSGAAGKTTCAEMLTYVNSILKGATATNMNIMLRAQMMGTALDVYFSDPNLGWTSTKVGAKKPPSNFFSGSSPLGAFVMDLTAICPMVDNTTTGTAKCKLGLPSTNGFASDAFPWASRSVQGILDYESTTTDPFNGNASNPIWYGGTRTKQEIAKNTFDQINNQQAFAP